jgi:ABC-type phosphate transport system permease subunit
MKQSPKKDENEYLSDGRINKIVKKAKMKVWLTSMPAVIGGVFGYAAAYFDQWWILILAGACALWIVLRK